MHRRRARSVVLAVALAAALILSPAASFAVSSSDAAAAESRAEAARRKQAQEQAEADKLLAETRALQARIDDSRKELGAIDSKVSTAEERREKLEREMSDLRRAIEGKKSEIASATAAYRQRSDTLSQRVDAVYRQGDLFYLTVLLESRSLTDLVTRTSFVQQVMLADQSIMTDLTLDRRKLESARVSLDRSLQELDAKRAEMTAEENALRRLQGDRAAKLAEERDAKSAKAGMLAETKENIERWRALAKAEDAEAARIKNLLKSSSSRGKGKVSGSMAWPTPGYSRVSSSFGWRTHPIYGDRRFHRGIDIAAPQGARIVAAAAGTVIYAGDRGGYGNCVMVDHGDGVVSVYAHMSSIGVSSGAKVSKGARIGAVGSTGASTGPHLHFEIRVNGEPRNPLNYL